MNLLSGKIAIVTGAASGIGLATSRALVKEGAIVALCDRSAENLATAVKSIGERAAGFTVDLTDGKDLDGLVSRVIDRFGKLDILHANAGIYSGGAVADGDPDAWDALLTLNVNSVFRMVKSAIPHFKERKTGDIIVTSSISGHIIVPHEPVYNASKHAVTAFVHALREQLVKNGIRVAEISPSLAATALLQSWPQDVVAPIIESKGVLDPNDVAEAVIFMLSRPRRVVIRDLVILAQGAQLVPFDH